MANPCCPVTCIGVPVNDLRVVDVHELRQFDGDKGRYFFQLCKDNGGALSRSTKTSWWLGHEMPFDVLAALVAKGKADGLIYPMHMQLFDPHNREASLALKRTMTAKYTPLEKLSNSSRVTITSASKRARKGPVSPAPVMPLPRWAPVATGDTLIPPGHELVDHFPLVDKMEVFAIDSDGNWCKGKVVLINALLVAATVHFDGWRKSYDMVHPLSSGKIRTMAAPPRKMIWVAQQVAQKLVTFNHPRMWDLNYSDDDESDDEGDNTVWVDDVPSDTRPALNHRTVNKQVQVYEDSVVASGAPGPSSAGAAASGVAADESEDEVEVDAEDDDVEDDSLKVKAESDDSEVPLAAAALASMQ